MMLKRFLIAAMLFLAACQSASPPPTETSSITPDTTTTSTVWLETQMNGVSLGMWKPAGWEGDPSNGLVVAEYTLAKNSSGIVVNCFVPPSDEFQQVDAASNYAWAVLDQVEKMPSHSGWDVAMTPPMGFEWDHLQAAYYLFSTGDGVRAIVLALTLPNQKRVIVCNISAPAAQADRIRALLPQLLDGLTINDTAMKGSELSTLPNPLAYPRYNRPAPPQPPPSDSTAS